MKSYGVILRKLREINQLSLKPAAVKVGRSVGWLSEIENGRGNARIREEEFERIVAAYGGGAYRRQFGAWVAKATNSEGPCRGISYGGAVLKFLRRKAGMSLEAAAGRAKISKSYLSLLEVGARPLTGALRNRLMSIYGYSPASFKNFTTEDRRGEKIPVAYKVEVLLRQLDEGELKLAFASLANIIKSKEY